MVTEPVQAWGKHPSIKLEANSTTPEALKYKATKATIRHTRLQGNKGSNASQGQQRHKGYHATKATRPQRQQVHKGNKAKKATTPQRRQGHEGNNTTKVNKPSRVHTNSHETETPERTQTDAPNAMAKNTTKMPKSFIPKFQQICKSYCGNKEGRINSR